MFTNVAIAAVVSTLFDIAIGCAVYAALNLIVWSWLALLLSLIAGWFADTIPQVAAVKQHAYNGAVAGTAKLVGWWRARQATEVAP